MASLVKAVAMAASGQLPGPESEELEPRLTVSVVYTSLEQTAAALRRAGALASSKGARVLLIVPQTVPYPAPLETPPVLLSFSEQRLRQIASECPVDITVHFYLCRERETALRMALRPGSVVVVGGHKRWWRTAEEKLVRDLRRAGHEVVFATE